MAVRSVLQHVLCRAPRLCNTLGLDATVLVHLHFLQRCCNGCQSLGPKIQDAHERLNGVGAVIFDHEALDL